MTTLNTGIVGVGCVLDIVVIDNVPEPFVGQGERWSVAHVVGRVATGEMLPEGRHLGMAWGYDECVSGLRWWNVEVRPVVYQDFLVLLDELASYDPNEAFDRVRLKEGVELYSH